MKISYEWLKCYCPELNGSPEQVAQRLLLAGFPVEAIDRVGDDVVLDVEVTSNRPDLLCHAGVAREVSALTGTRFAPPKVNPAGSANDALNQATSVVAQTADCPLYTARLIRNVKVGASPAWMVRRLTALGLRSINNVVDITNYVLFELSQPLHAFDFDRLNERRIVVRKAKSGERLTSIDGHVRELDGGMMVIADATRPVAVAGIMGGLETEVSAGTTTVLLESAYFDPMSVRATARKLGLFSDSSFRFERGVDLGGVVTAANRAADLMAELCGGQVVGGVLAAGSAADSPVSVPRVTMRFERLRKLMALDVAPSRIAKILSGLQLSPELAADSVTVSVPSFRPDIRREVDVIEEVARVEGYDKIPVRDRIELQVRPPDFRMTTVRRIARALCGQGFSETVSTSFVPSGRAELFARGEAGHLEVSHASRRQESGLRRSLLPSLLASRRVNETVQNRRADLFEIASVFNPPPASQSLPVEPLRMGLTSDGSLPEVRGAIEEVVRVLDPSARVELAPGARSEFAPGRGAEVLLNGEVIGLAGEPNESVRAMFELHQAVTVAEIDVAPLLALAGRQRRCSPLSRFPAIERDVSILVDDSVTWRQIEQAIRSAGAAELESVEFVDLFRGKQLGEGKKSITLSLRYRSFDGTLTGEQANGFAASAVSAMSAQVGAVLRDK